MERVMIEDLKALACQLLKTDNFKWHQKRIRRIPTLNFKVVFLEKE